MWCHCRAVYLPMSYIYGKRFVGRITPLVLELRNELYEDPYNLIDWNKARNQCAKVCWKNYLASIKNINPIHTSILDSWITRNLYV